MNHWRQTRQFECPKCEASTGMMKRISMTSSHARIVAEIEKETRPNHLTLACPRRRGTWRVEPPWPPALMRNKNP